MTTPIQTQRDSAMTTLTHPTDEQVWLSMWSATASAWNCKSVDAAARWADQGLEQYRKRFPNDSSNTEPTKAP